MDYRADAAESFDEDRVIYAFLPHMHLRGKSFRFTAVYPDGRKEVLPRLKELPAPQRESIQAVA